MNKTAEKSSRTTSANPTFKQRIARTKPTRWVRFGIVVALWCFFCVWVGSWWLWLLLIPLFDVYITNYVPLTWWKKSKNKTLRTVMSWVDAIVYALVLVYFVFNFIGQNYQIPSSSLEKTLLTGDYLFVDKITYGPRVPMTPVNFPLVHNTLPIVNCDSYLNSPSNSYHRLKGLRKVESGDIVVFNFPAGDTVMSKANNPDYYHLTEMFGYEAVNNNPDVFGKKIWRPVDRRENYVKRTVGLPGERFKIVNGEIYIDGQKQPLPANAQYNYYFQTVGLPMTDDDWKKLGVAEIDRNHVTFNGEPNSFAMWLKNNGMKFNGFRPAAPIYVTPMTNKMLEQMKANPKIGSIVKMPGEVEQLSLYPSGLATPQKWTRENYGGEDGILIPAKGMTVKLDHNNWLLYERPIRVYENNPTAQWRDGKVWIDGKPVDTYTFKMDYYFMMGDNRDNSLDSRYWGFVPEDHIVGRPVAVLISFDRDKGIFNGGIRWNRILRDANPDK